MPSSNFLVWDPSLTNAESDAAYSADSIRSGGAPANAILPSALDNKFRYQTSTFVSAFAQMMVNKGYTLSDANFTNLVTALANVRTAADTISSIQAVTYAGSITFNAGIAPGFDLTLTGNVAASSLTGYTPGQILIFIISQDGTGGRTFSWPSALTGHGSVSPLASSTSIQAFIVLSDGVTIKPYSSMIAISASGTFIATSFLPAVVAISTTGTVSSANAEILEKVDATSGTVSRTLYSAVGATGQKVTIKKIDSSANSVNILGTGGQTIDGLSSISITLQYNALTMISDGANWMII